MKSVLKGLPWKRLWKIGKPFWVSDKRNIALLHLGAVLALLSANAGMSVFINYAAGHFMTAIEQRSVPEFYHYLMVYAGALLCVTPIQVFYGFLRTRLALTWRTWLSSALFAGYFSNLAYYKLLNNGEIDNPDQRMTQDVDSFCNSSVGLFISILDSVVNVVMFIGLLWAISPLLTFTVIAYSAIGSLIVVLIGKALVGLNFQQMKTEADLRFGLAEARREAEAIAFYRGEEITSQQARTRLGKVIDTLMSIMRVNRNIQFFTNSYNLLMPLIPAAIIAPMYFAREVPFGNITQATMAFTIVFNGATFMINQFGGISSYTAIINRLGSFIEALEACGVQQMPSDKQIEVREGQEIRFENVSVLTPDLTRELVTNLSVDVKIGDSLLITGPDGSGKTALLRTIASIWNSGSGKLTRPGNADMMFLSQNPYLPAISLRQAIGYPCLETCPDDARLMQILKLVNLPELVKRAGGLDTVQNWRDFLSLSEQQRLSMARIIFARPKFAVIDEATSALEGDNEKLLYSLLAGFGTTVVSTGNGANLVKYHANVLELTGNGSWKLCKAADYKKEAPVNPSQPDTAAKLPTDYTFPKQFVWGTGTSAYQVEGAWDAGGKGESIWDRFSHTPGKVKNGDTGDVACNQYHRFAEDIALCKQLNLNSYRFSISWPRVQPGGRGAFNEVGMDFYDRMINELLAQGIEPFVTLYHWDLPQELQDIGGWANREVCQLFADYAAKMVERYGDRVKFWTTFNEPWCTSFLGYEVGVHAPGLVNPQMAAQAAHHLLLSHGMASIAMRTAAEARSGSNGSNGSNATAPAFRDGSRDIEVGIVLNLTITEPLHDNEEDRKLAEENWRRDCGYYLDPLLRGFYCDEALKGIKQIEVGDLAVINQKLDFLGINYYMRNIASKSAKIHPVEGHEYTQMGWEVHAPSLRNLLTRITSDYKNVGLPKMYVTENGAAFEDSMDSSGVVADPRRLNYIHDHVEQVGLAIADGADIRGYFAWSLLDNFEWAEGYARRFGIVYVDFETQKRTIKDSGRWFASTAKSNKLTAK